MPLGEKVITIMADSFSICLLMAVCIVTGNAAPTQYNVLDIAQNCGKTIIALPKTASGVIGLQTDLDGKCTVTLKARQGYGMKFALKSIHTPDCVFSRIDINSYPSGINSPNLVLSSDPYFCGSVKSFAEPMELDSDYDSSYTLEVSPGLDGSTLTLELWYSVYVEGSDPLWPENLETTTEPILIAETDPAVSMVTEFDTSETSSNLPSSQPAATNTVKSPVGNSDTITAARSSKRTQATPPFSSKTTFGKMNTTPQGVSSSTMEVFSTASKLPSSTELNSEKHTSTIGNAATATPYPRSSKQSTAGDQATMTISTDEPVKLSSITESPTGDVTSVKMGSVTSKAFSTINPSTTPSTMKTTTTPTTKLPTTTAATRPRPAVHSKKTRECECLVKYRIPLEDEFHTFSIEDINYSSLRNNKLDNAYCHDAYRCNSICRDYIKKHYPDGLESKRFSFGSETAGDHICGRINKPVTRRMPVVVEARQEDCGNGGTSYVTTLDWSLCCTGRIHYYRKVDCSKISADDIFG